MGENSATEMNYNLVSVWLDRARSNAPKCFICMRIAQGNVQGKGEIKPIKISGVELSAETQITHLSRCVGPGEGRP